MERWKKSDVQPNVVLKAAPDAVRDRKDDEHIHHKKILAPGFRTPPKIPVMGLPVNIPASSPNISKKDLLKAQRLKRKQDRHKKFNQKPSPQLKTASSFLSPKKVEPKKIGTEFKNVQSPVADSQSLRHPTKMMNIPPLSKLKKLFTPKINPFTAYNSTTVVSENSTPKAHLKHGNPDQIWHDGKKSDFDGVMHDLQHMANPDKLYVNKFKPKRVQQQKIASQSTSTTEQPQTLATIASTTSGTQNRIFRKKGLHF